MSTDPRVQSRTVLDGCDRVPAWSMSNAIGFTDECADG
jgi:hypothetical protein